MDGDDYEMVNNRLGQLVGEVEELKEAAEQINDSLQDLNKTLGKIVSAVDGLGESRK